MKAKLYQHLASKLQALRNCEARIERTDDHDEAVCAEEWRIRHEESIEELCADWLPSGSGFDTGTVFDFEKSTSDKLVLLVEFHHTDEHGSYEGWTKHDVTVRPCLASGFTLKVSGRDRNNIKDYIAEVFQHDLDKEVEL